MVVPCSQQLHAFFAQAVTTLPWREQTSSNSTPFCHRLSRHHSSVTSRSTYGVTVASGLMTACVFCETARCVNAKTTKSLRSGRPRSASAQVTRAYSACHPGYPSCTCASNCSVVTQIPVKLHHLRSGMLIVGRAVMMRFISQVACLLLATSRALAGQPHKGHQV